MKKNLLIVTSTFPRWKNDTDPPFVYELAKRLSSDFNVTVLTPNYPGALVNETMEGIIVHRFRYFLARLEILAGSEGILPTLKRNKLFYLLVPFFILGELIALLKIIKNFKPDVIHAHWILPQGFVAALAYKMTGVPFVVTTHGGDIYGLQSRFVSALKGYTLRNAVTVTVVSKDIQNTIKHRFGEDIHTDIISMGVDSKLFNPNKKNNLLKEQYGIAGPFLLFVGRLTEKKGAKYLIRAMPEIHKEFPESKLLIIGTGETEHELIQLTNSIGLEKQVVFTGAIPNKELPGYFATADIFIGPSVTASGGDTEGFGLTFVEASMSGCIVVGTNVGGITDIIEDGETGFLVQEKNPQAIAEVLVNILQDKQHHVNMHKNAREKMIARFDWQSIADRYAKLLDSTANHKQQAGSGT
jgi:glycosyltransferase involved in cell wall biosynthesis